MFHSTLGSSPSFLEVFLSYIRFLHSYYSCSAIKLSGIVIRFIAVELNCLSCNTYTHKLFPTPSCPQPARTNIELSRTCSVSNLSLFYSNVRSVLPKLSFLKHYISMYAPSIVAITETWLSDDVPSEFLDFPGYKCLTTLRVLLPVLVGLFAVSSQCLGS